MFCIHMHDAMCILYRKYTRFDSFTEYFLCKFWISTFLMTFHVVQRVTCNGKWGSCVKGISIIMSILFNVFHCKIPLKCLLLKKNRCTTVYVLGGENMHKASCTLKHSMSKWKRMINCKNHILKYKQEFECGGGGAL